MALVKELAGIKRHIAAGRLNEAMANLSMLVERHPEDEDLRRLQVQLRVKTGQDRVSGRRCPICGSEDLLYELVYKTLFGHDQVFVRCDRCGVLFDERPKPIDYTETFFDENPFLNIKAYIEKNTSFLLSTHILLQVERTLRALGRGNEKGFLVDIGCGPGILVDIAKHMGWKSLGVDSNIRACEAGRRIIGVPMIHFTVGHTLPLRNVDAIVSLNLVEHLSSPRGFLRAVYNALRPDGVAIFQTPNALSKSYGERKSSWPHMGLGYHFLLHTAFSMERVLKEVGFQGVQVYTFNGEYDDEELICIASRAKPNFDFFRTGLHPFRADSEAVSRCIEYCGHNLEKFDEDRGSMWLGSLFRLLELLNMSKRYPDTIARADELEAHLRAGGIDIPKVERVLEQAIRSGDRSVFHKELHTFFPDLYYLRGVACQQQGEHNRAAADLYQSYSLWNKIEALPDPSWTEVVSVPPSLRCLFSLAACLHRIGKAEDAREAFAVILARREELAHAPAFLAHTLSQYARVLESLEDTEGALGCHEAVIRLYHANHLSRDLYLPARNRMDEIRKRRPGKGTRQKDDASAAACNG